MKYFKLINGVGWPSFKEGKTYRGDYSPSGNPVWYYAKVIPNDWLEVSKPKKSLSEKIEVLKKQAEKEGMKMDVVFESKDIWDGVEFALNPKGFVRKIEKIEHGLIYFIGDFWYHKNVCKPSTEQAYIEQLKKECFGMHNDKLESSKIDDSNMHGGRIRFESRQGDSFQYRKDTDTLYWCGIPVYQQGKWATRVKERVKVEYEMASTSGKNYLNLSYKVSRDIKGKEIAEIALFLASQLEKYLNREIE